jgi:NAD(P)-dependent dehydrogenase (short-subunit alcohol dehydrogenase family)
MSARRLRESVVVITGASSGIGRATALRFARKGAAVVLTARNETALRELATECTRLGARALVLPADVADETSMKELAQLAAGAFQRIDIWVNNAAESLFVRFEDTPPESFRQLVEADLFGYLHGARAALPYFRQQGSGVLINVSSVFGTLGAPYLNAYATSKYALRGLSESLRKEGREAHLRVVSVLPATLNSPLLHAGATVRPHSVKPLEPLYIADRVARAIVRSALHPKRELYVSGAGRKPRLLRTLLRRPRLPATPAKATAAPLPAPATPAAASEGRRHPSPLRTGLMLGLLAVPVLLGWRWLTQGRGFFF